MRYSDDYRGEIQTKNHKVSTNIRLSGFKNFKYIFVTNTFGHNTWLIFLIFVTANPLFNINFGWPKEFVTFSQFLDGFSQIILNFRSYGATYRRNISFPSFIKSSRKDFSPIVFLYCYANAHDKTITTVTVILKIPNF